MPSLDRLRELSAWKVTATLWLVRWMIILPLNWAAAQFAPRIAQAAAPDLSGGTFSLLLLLVFAAPLAETLVECSLPHWILSKTVVGRVPPGPFVLVSASVMAALHLASLLAVVNAFVTGAFIACVYWHARRGGHGPAVLHASVFHGAINLVGWSMLVVGRHGA